ncbi:MAG: peptide ABC transporter substrate-binding protein [Dehalococcoidia bacterium]|nr:peptide ABC transporter substrate-binding protein [Dehalococcoidia bacterium]MSQ17880.1 peptide ABC transporter substrate-binding protein [Dehalococcoidia bacterium]
MFRKVVSLLTFGLLGLLGLLVVTGCSKPAQSPAATPGSATAAPVTKAQPLPVGAPKPKGGTLVRLGTDPVTLDPHLANDTSAAAIIVEVFGGLTTIDPELNIVPDLAERWDVSPSGMVYTFHLNPKAKFHDGRPVTAEDVRWSLERAADPRTQSPVVDTYLGDIVGIREKLGGKAQTVAGVRVVDNSTVEITIDAPKAYFLAKLTYPTAFVLDRKNVEANPRNWSQKPNGTGPFKLTQYELGQTMTLTANAAYHLGAPNVDAVKFILGGGSAMLMYENDEIHITGVGLADLERVQDPKNPLNKQLLRAPPQFEVGYYGLNVKEPPFDDPKVRMALNLAIDRESIATNVLEGLAAPAKGVLPPGFPGFNPALKGYEYNPDKARQLLKESKYGGDMSKFPPITLSVPGNLGASVGLDTEVILQSWKQELGITVEIQQTEWATFLQDVQRRKYQMFELGWIADYPDPQDFLDVLFHSKSDNNHVNYNNPEVDRLLKQARVEPDQAKRFQQYQVIEQMVLEDAPWVPLWHGADRYVLIKPNVHDYYLLPMIIPRWRYVYVAAP